MKVIITTSFLPISPEDKLPAFVKEQAEYMKQENPEIDILIHAPHSHNSKKRPNVTRNFYYQEFRFHYFWPHRFELLAAGNGILSNLKSNIALYLQIPFLILFQFISLLRLTRKEQPDLIYAHWFTPQSINSALVSKLTGVPFSFTTHASDVSILKRLPFSKALVRWVCRNARSYTAVSINTKNKLKYFFSEEEWHREFSRKLSILPMGIDTTPPPITSKYINETQRKYTLDERPILLYLGRLAEKKGVRYLLEAIAKLPEEKIQSLQVIIAGDGLLRKNLEYQAQELNLTKVIFTGFVNGNEKHALLALSDFLCIPSIIDSSGDSEGFPVVLMEGLAFGKVVLASDVSGAENIFRHGVNGFLFQNSSSFSLRQTLIDVYCMTEKQKEKIIKESRKLATNFDWRVIAKNYLKIILSSTPDK